MKVLFLGGTGIISTACTRLAAERGIQLDILTRGQREAELPAGVRHLEADLKDPHAIERFLKGRSWDSVVSWISYNPADIARDLALFEGRTGQYIFISSASAYQKPATDFRVTESTPLVNPYWQYSRNKIAAEEALMQAVRDRAFPGVIVRPSHTYGDSSIPLAVNSWTKPYTAIDRMLRGLPVIVHGDGSSLWTLTHNSDFAIGLVGLLGHAQSIGHAFHITSDEALSWDQIYRIVGRAAGVEPILEHISTDFLAACHPGRHDGLIGDKSVCAVFDNSKIKRFVPEFLATTTLARGIVATLAWFQSDPSRMAVDQTENERWDAILRGHRAGVENAKAALARLSH